MRRGAVRKRRDQLRRELAALRERTRTRLDENPAIQRERARRRRRRARWLALLLALLVLLRCERDSPAPPPTAPVPEHSVPGQKTPREARKKPAPKNTKSKPFSGKIASQSRSEYEVEARLSPIWLDRFRLQVASRSPRLAECFTGTERPGALRWTTALNPASGAVSDHELEPLGPIVLSAEQRACVLKVLSEPPYRLEGNPGPLPDRVGLVIEF